MANAPSPSQFSDWKKKFGKIMINLAFTNLLFNNPSSTKAIESRKDSSTNVGISVSSERIVIELPSKQISESVERIKSSLPSADKIKESLQKVRDDVSSNVRLPNLDNFKDTTNLKEFHINIPQNSQLLKATRRTVDVAAGDRVDIVDQLRNSLSNIHITVPPLAHTGTNLHDLRDIDLKEALSDWRVLSIFVALVIYSDRVQDGKQMAPNTSDKEEQLNACRPNQLGTNVRKNSFDDNSNKKNHKYWPPRSYRQSNIEAKPVEAHSTDERSIDQFPDSKIPTTPNSVAKSRRDLIEDKIPLHSHHRQNSHDDQRRSEHAETLPHSQKSSQAENKITARTKFWPPRSYRQTDSQIGSI